MLLGYLHAEVVTLAPIAESWWPADVQSASKRMVWFAVLKNRTKSKTEWSVKSFTRSQIVNVQFICAVEQMLSKAKERLRDDN